MHFLLNFNSFFLTMAAGIGFLQFFHLLFSRKENAFSNRILAIFLLAILYINLLNSLWLEGFLQQIPHLFRTTRPLSYLFAPLLYLYIRASFNKEKRFKKYDWILIIPVILVIIEFIPFYMSPVDYKIKMILKAESDGIDLQEGLLIGRFHAILFLIYDICYTMFLFNYIKKLSRDRTFSAQEEQIITWVKHLILFSVIVVFLLLGLYLLKVENNVALKFYFFQNAFMVYFISFYLLIKPGILNGVYEESNTRKIETINPVNFSTHKITQYTQLLDNLMLNEKVYLEKKLTLKMLSDKSGITLHQLSAFINKKYGMSFNDYINKLRIEYILERIGKNEWKKYSFEGMAKEAGFSSRTTFFSAFKRFTSLSPSDYLKKMENPNFNSENSQEPE